MPLKTPTVEFYMSDFGNIKAPGLRACLANHKKTKVWKWVDPDRHILVELGHKRRRVKEYLCAKKCGACKLEAALNNFAEKVWLTGGLLREIRADGPPTGPCPDDILPKIKGTKLTKKQIAATRNKWKRRLLETR